MMHSYEASAPWRERWLEGRTGWDQGQEHSALAQLLRSAQGEAGLKQGERIFSAGCGRAHNEAWLARQGFQVEAIDVVPEAIAAAKELYADIPGLTLRVQDVFHADLSRLSYAAVFDRAMLCALQPDHRPAYIKRISSLLKPGGLLMSLPFRVVRSPEGPPFALNEAEAWQLLGADFDLCFASSLPLPINPQNVLEEWLCIWSKREGAA